MPGDNKKPHGTGAPSTPTSAPPPPLTSDGPTARPEPEFPGLESSRVSLHSLTYAMLRPDALHPRTVACTCGRQLNIDDDWYTEIYDGTLLCWQCASCAKCGVDGSVACRRLVSIGGAVLCYDCLKRYGDPRTKEWRPQIVGHPHKRLKRTMRKMAAASQDASENQSSCFNFTGGRHNVGGFYTNWWECERSPECRKLLRYRDYPRPDKCYESATDPRHTAIGYYDATPVQFSRMACPACKSQALGPSCCVAPAISLVYHRRCFRCVACKWPLGVGDRVPGKHYVFCTCQPPLQWCTRPACQAERQSHHEASKCCIEPVHPGGREQRDTMECAAKLGAVQAKLPRKKKGDNDQLGDDNDEDDSEDAKTATSAASQQHQQQEKQQQEKQKQAKQQMQLPPLEQHQQKQQQPLPPKGSKPQPPIAASEAARKPRKSALGQVPNQAKNAKPGILNQQQQQMQPLQPQHGIKGSGAGTAQQGKNAKK